MEGDDSLECPVGSIAGYRDDECFVLSTQRRNWGDAEEDCFYTFGGELMSVHDERTNDFVAIVLKTINNPLTDIWLGATRSSNSPFFWWDGSPFNFTRLSTAGHCDSTICAMLFNGGTWDVDSAPDSNQRWYICKFPARKVPLVYQTTTPHPSGPVVCPAYSVVGPESTCYMPGFPAKDFAAAKDDCARRGGTLASVHNGESNELLASHLSLLRERKFWLGGALHSSKNPLLLREWQWIDGSPFNYTNWAPGQVINGASPGAGNNELRTLFDANSGLWYSTEYQDSSGNPGPEHASICAVKIWPDMRYARCPIGAFVGLSEICYLIGTDAESWSDAEKQCNKQGGTLASIDDWRTNLAVLHILRMHSSQWYWIGASNQTGTWTWSNGNAFNFSNWDNEETDVRDEGVSRTEILRATPVGAACGSIHGMDGKWRFDSPDTHRPYICSVLPRWYIPTNTTTTLTTTNTMTTKVKATSSSNAVDQITTTSGKDRRNIIFPIVVGGSSLAVVVALAVVAVGWYTLRKRSREIQRLIDATDQTCSTVESAEEKGGVRLGELLLQFHHHSLSTGRGTWIDIRDLQISTCIIGSGAFADVYKAKLFSRPVLKHEGIGEDPTHITNDVAVKMSRGGLRESQRDSLLQEAELMYQIGGNPHILRLIGHALLNDQPILVLEYCARGDLLTILRKTLGAHKDAVSTRKEDLQVTPYRDTKIALVDLISLCWQISDGMLYLSSKGYIHRDLAARNILLSSEMVAKIADFGLCRYSDEQLYTMQIDTKLPVKWCAPEALSKAQFSAQSDVWSFGVLLYEIFSAGGVPYEDVCPTEMLKHLNQGHRQEQPDLCPADTYRLMLDCWNETPSERPTFESVRSYFTDCLEYLSKEYGYIIPSDISEASLLQSQTTAGNTL